MSWSSTLLYLWEFLSFAFYIYLLDILYFIPWVLYYEIELHKDINGNIYGFITTIITALLTQPMHFFLYLQLDLSHFKLQKAILDDISKKLLKSLTGRDEMSVKEISLEEDAELKNSLQERSSLTISSIIIEDTNSIQISTENYDTNIGVIIDEDELKSQDQGSDHNKSEEKSTLSLKDCRIISSEFCNLTTAWSPFYLWGYACECIILINAGFVIAKQTQNFVDYKSYELVFISFLMINSIIAVSLYSLPADCTHEVLKKFGEELR